jgi:hypothetical protein
VGIGRRDFVRYAAAAAAAASTPLGFGCGGDNGNNRDSLADGTVAHLLPTASSDRILIKASFTSSLDRAPDLVVDGKRFRGEQTDGDGRFFLFDAAGLEADTRYTLELRSGSHEFIAPWELSTLPAPEATRDRFRLLLYTCAGGHDLFGFVYIRTEVRRRLLQRALSFQPDAVVANGDHTYWDLRGQGALTGGGSPGAIAHAGEFERDAPILGHRNEQVLKLAVDSQIAGLYRDIFKSLPVFFLRDDHDYYENDEVTGDLITFPPADFERRLARVTQHLYYPEFLPDRNRPANVPGSNARDRPRGVSEAFGTIRYGRLFEAMLYDCKGFVSLDGAAGRIVPADVEAWLHARMADDETAHVVHLPSNPPGYTAGKFAEWYPDVLGSDDELTTDIPKPGWQPGWFAQHNRLLASASAMNRVPLFMSGDIHGIAEEMIVRSGDLDLSSNPIVSVITGTPGTGAGWPSAARGTRAQAPEAIEAEDVVAPLEMNGFHIADFEPDRVTIRHFRWRQRDGVEAIDTLEPFQVSEYATGR